MAPRIRLGTRFVPLLFALSLVFPSMSTAQARDWTVLYDSGDSDWTGCASCQWGYFNPAPPSLFSTRAVAADAAGNSWVVGSSFNGENYDVRIVKYNAEGVEQWAELYDSGGDDAAASVGVDSAGNAYVGGSSILMTNYYDLQPHALVVKFGPAGNFLWQRTYRDSVYALGLSLVVKPTGHSYLALRGYSEDDFVYSQVLETLPNGSAGWEDYSWFGFDYEESSPSNLSLDANGNLYMVGAVYKPQEEDYQDYYVMKWGPSGSPVSSWRWTSGVPGTDTAYDVAVDETGRIFVIGNRGLSAFSATGALLWAKPFAGAAHAVAAGNGAVYVTGSAGSGSGQDIVTTRYNAATGAPVWTKTSGGSGEDKGIALRLVGANVWVAGTSSNGANNDALLVGLDAATGTEIGQDRIDQSGAESVVAMTGVGNRLWLAGRADGNFLTARYTVPVSAGPSLLSLTLSVTTFPGGCKSSNGWVTLSAPAPAGGVVVSLSDNLPATTLPASVTVPAGQSRTSFPITAPHVATKQTGVVTASYGGTSQSATLTVRPLAVSSLVLGSNPVTGPARVDGSVLLECAAGPGGVTVRLSSTNTAVAWPSSASMVIPAGASTGRFTVSTADVATTQYADIRAAADGGGKTVRLQVN
jgi:hypothetical protein